MKNTCPVCERHIFEEKDDHDFCPVCGWENDGVQGNDHDYWGGANELSVNEEKIRCEIILCKEKSTQLKYIDTEYEREATRIEMKYANADSSKELDKEQAELQKVHDEYFNKLINLQRS